MGFSISSGAYQILESGIVTAFDADSDITFRFTGDERFKFGFNVKLIFLKDESGKQGIDTTINNGTIELVCTNFSDAGTGLGVPVKLATSGKKSVYFRFWSFFEGDIEGKAKTRKVEFTFFVGE